jgi:hypothetical protein
VYSAGIRQEQIAPIKAKIVELGVKGVDTHTKILLRIMAIFSISIPRILQV